MNNEYTNNVAVIGYSDKLRVQPGGSISFHISSFADEPVEGRVLRVICGDPNPKGPGIRLIETSLSLPKPEYAAEFHRVPLGSYASAPIIGCIMGDRLRTKIAFQPTMQKISEQLLFAVTDMTSSIGLAACLIAGEVCIKRGRIITQKPPKRSLSDTSASSSGPDWCHTGINIYEHRWYELEVVWNHAGATVTVQTDEGGAVGPFEYVLDSTEDSNTLLEKMHIAGLPDELPRWCFNGRVESPLISKIDNDDNQIVLGAWNFCDNMSGMSIPGLFNKAHALQLVNCPTRAVRGRFWSGRTMDWKHAPQEYAAIHFHEDDLIDCKWPKTITLEIPLGTESGAYVLDVKTSYGTDQIPFFVTPRRDARRKRVAVLIPTMTYLAYSNHARGNLDEAFKARVKAWSAYPHNADEVHEYGLSTYNRHVDGSGISIVSYHRPIVSMRPGYLTFNDARGSGLRHYPADTHLISWLTHNDIDFDMITDEDLDEFGYEYIKNYKVIMSTSHPEYYTRKMSDAIIEFRKQGGNFMYLGGNGFYWKIARNSSHPYLMEIRRAEGGIRAWASEPGEYYNQFDGEYGGLWRRNGRPPQKLGGLGFAVQGLYEGSYYERTERSYDEKYAWLFDGVTGRRFGDHGLFGGGAAGFELDQADINLGTPDNTQIVAVSGGHGPSFMSTPEEVLGWTVPMNSTRSHSGIHAHMIYCPKQNNRGALFAVGSITFIGSLYQEGYETDISRILHNCLSKFVD